MIEVPCLYCNKKIVLHICRAHCLHKSVHVFFRYDYSYNLERIHLEVSNMDKYNYKIDLYLERKKTEIRFGRKSYILNNLIEVTPETAKDVVEKVIKLQAFA